GELRHRRDREPPAAQQRPRGREGRRRPEGADADRLHAGAFAEPEYPERGAWSGRSERPECSESRRRPMTPVLEIKGLSVDYGLGGKGVRAVREVALTLRRGEVLGLAGESGSGKSTLAYGATRLLAPPGVVSGGSVLYHPDGGEPVDVLRMTHA